MDPGLDSGAKKGYWWIAGEIQIKFGIYLIVVYQCWFLFWYMYDNDEGVTSGETGWGI